MLGDDGAGSAGADQRRFDGSPLSERSCQCPAERVTGAGRVHRIDPEGVDVQRVVSGPVQRHSPGTSGEDHEPGTGGVQPVDAAELGALGLVHDQHIDVGEHPDRRRVCGRGVQDRQRSAARPARSAAATLARGTSS